MSLLGRFGGIRGGILLYYSISSNVADLPESSKLLGITSKTHTWGHSSAGRAPAWHLALHNPEKH